MSKMNIAQASEYFGISKEAIHNRIRRGSLSSVVEDGIKFVIIDAASSKTSQTNTVKSRSKRASVTVTDNRYYQFIEEQNTRLQEKVDKLENETKTLREQKEQMLIEDKDKLEQIYKDKDEQLKSILHAISSNFLPNVAIEEVFSHEEEKEDLVEAEIEEIDDNKLISLKKYLRKNKYSKKKIKKIKTIFKKRVKKDKRVKKIGNKYYINISKYNYDDLINKKV